MPHLVCLLWLALTHAPLVREVVHQEGVAIPIRVPVAAPDRLLTTAVIFPEEALADVIAGWDPSQISLERAYGQLFLRLLDKDHRGHLDVLGKSGRLYRLYLEPAADGEHDESVRITLASEAAKEILERADQLGPLELMRAMKLGEVPQGVEVEEVLDPEKGWPLRLYDDGQRRLCVRWAYRTPYYTGYVLMLVNLDARPYDLDITRFSLPGLLLIGADRYHLGAPDHRRGMEHTTLIYLVQHN